MYNSHKTNKEDLIVAIVQVPYKTSIALRVAGEGKTLTSTITGAKESVELITDETYRNKLWALSEAYDEVIDQSTYELANPLVIYQATIEDGGEE